MRLSPLAQAVALATTTLTLTACGNDSDTNTVIHDVTPPVLNIDSGFTDNNTAVAAEFVSGEVIDNGGIRSLTYQINNNNPQNFTVDETGHFDGKIFLKAGSNKVVMTATDTTGNQMQVSKTIYLGDTIAAGNSHTGALKNGQLYTWGNNNSGQTGLGMVTKLLLADKKEVNPQHPATPMLMSQAPKNIASINFNQNHSLAIGENGHVYSWGDDRFNQLGRGDIGRSDCNRVADCRFDFGIVEGIDDAVMIAAGYQHNLVLTEDGSVWAFGANGEGQLGNGTAISSSVPVKVDFAAATDVGRIVQVAASSGSSYALDDKGQVWGWGSDDYANLGKGIECTRANSCVNVNATPTLISVIKDTTTGEKVTQLAAGRDHVLALTNKDSVYGWGLNASSQVGYNGANYKDTVNAWRGNITSPTKLPWFTDKAVHRIYANGNTSYVLLDDGKVYPWGVFGETNSAGITIYSNLNEPTNVLPSLTDINNMAMGALHFIAQDKTNNLYTWGWSFEGSLGSELATNIWMYNIPFPINLPSQ